MAFPESPESHTKPENARNSNRKSHLAGRRTPSSLRPIENHGQAKSQIASAATNPKSPKPLRHRAFISQAPLQRRHPPPTPPSTRKILASRDILPRVITVLQRRHHLQQTCKSKNTVETPFATYKSATLPFSPPSSETTPFLAVSTPTLFPFTLIEKNKGPKQRAREKERSELHLPLTGKRSDAHRRRADNERKTRTQSNAEQRIEKVWLGLSGNGNSDLGLTDAESGGSVTGRRSRGRLVAMVKSERGMKEKNSGDSRQSGGDAGGGNPWREQRWWRQSVERTTTVAAKGDDEEKWTGRR
ncbi:uncharacterized protein HKW66_Vig0127440 [Vigna angularis]|uniref:Uncharacterized protein n=1 Tax=Phaseolus angularis TaxID=3914 RepID=A0A8T0K729_PHAAN|nr:uncharacterized protein HKW66_Vig0127440 [Vigna angularis]